MWSTIGVLWNLSGSGSLDREESALIREGSSVLIREGSSVPIREGSSVLIREV